MLNAFGTGGSDGRKCLADGVQNEPWNAFAQPLAEHEARLDCSDNKNPKSLWESCARLDAALVE